MSQGTWQRDQMGASCKQQPQAGRNVACVKNCGFFGNDTTLNMCPNCYRAYTSSHADSSPADPSTLAPNPSDATVPLSAQASGSLGDSPADPSSSAPAAAAGPEACLIPDSSHLDAINEDDGTLLARASLLDPAAASASRARFPRVQSATASESRDGSSAGECCEDAQGVEKFAMALPADSLVRTNASRQLDVQMQPPAPSLSTPSPAAASRPSLSPSPAAAVAAAAACPAPVKAPSGAPKPNRCQVCRKKVGLTGFKCRCKGLFCGVHRYDDQHSCTFDYKAAGREAIAKANPVVVADKIVRF